jgi:hypothetical protein
MHDVAADRLTKEAGFDVVPGGRTPFYAIGPVAIRLKHLDRSLKPSNVMTRRQRRIARQQPLPGLEDRAHIVVGYRLDVTESEVSKVVAVKWVGSTLEWSIDLHELASGVLEPVAPVLPLVPATPAEVVLPAFTVEETPAGAETSEP